MLAAMVVGVLMVWASAAHAHEGHGLTVGTVVAIEETSLQLKTAKATVTIKLTPATKFEKDKKPADRALMVKGDRVGVATTKTAAGELVASRVVLGLPVPKAAQPKTPTE
jgi:hypothetical protein